MLLDADFFARDPCAKTLCNLGLRRQIFANCDSNIFQRLLARRSLTVAAREIITPDRKALFGFDERHVVVHRLKMQHSGIFLKRFFFFNRSRTTAEHGRSQKRREIAGVDLGIDFLERFVMLASRREIRFEFLVPGQIVTARDVRSQFRQLLGRQLIDGALDFCKAHNRTLAAAGSISNTVRSNASYLRHLAGRFCFMGFGGRRVAYVSMLVLQPTRLPLQKIRRAYLFVPKKTSNAQHRTPNAESVGVVARVLACIPMLMSQPEPQCPDDCSYRSSGVRPVRFAIRASILGPISSRS